MTHEQMKLFEPNVIEKIQLRARSPQEAFYNLYLEFDGFGYYVRKESGARKKVLDKRRWPANSFKEAQKLYLRKKNEKMSKNRKSPRIYQLVA